MTPQQQEELRSAIRSDPACADALAARDCLAIAKIRSAGRLRLKPTIIGDGTIIEAFIAALGGIGLDSANIFLDWFRSEPLFRHVVRLMDRGELRLDKPSTLAMLAQMATDGRIPQGVVDALIDFAREPDLLSQQDVSDALFNSDGSEK